MRKPFIDLYRRIMSLRVLFRAVPMCTSPLVKGEEPSWRTKTGASDRFFWNRNDRDQILAQWAARTGSRCAKPARIGKLWS